MLKISIYVLITQLLIIYLYFYNFIFSEKTIVEDLESFLNTLKLSNLIVLFKMNNVSIKDLLNYTDEDMKKVIRKI